MCYRVYSVYRAIEQEHEWSMNIHNVVLCNDKIFTESWCNGHGMLKMLKMLKSSLADLTDLTVSLTVLAEHGWTSFISFSVSTEAATNSENCFAVGPSALGTFCPAVSRRGMPTRTTSPLRTTPEFLALWILWILCWGYSADSVQIGTVLSMFGALIRYFREKFRHGNWHCIETNAYNADAYNAYNAYALHHPKRSCSAQVHRQRLAVRLRLSLVL